MSNETAIASLKEKIDDLNQHAWEVRVTDLPKSYELSQESVKLARSINYPKGLADGLRSLGFSYVRYSKNDEAAPLLKESLSLFQSLNDLKGQAVIYEYLGIIERNWGNLGASLDLLLKANELVLQIGSQEIEITCSYQLGVTYKHLGDHENALDYLYKTLSLAKKMNFALMEAYATNIIGSIYFDNGNYNQALDCYQQGLPIRRQSHDKWGEAGSLDNIGFTYLKLNDLDKAIDHCKQSLAICQATGDKKGEANALLHLGEIYEQAGDIKQAADFSNKSLEIRKERGDKRGETEVLLFLADLYKNRNDVEDHQIFEWLSNALKIADEVKAQDLLSKTHFNLHEYYQYKGNFKESLVQLEAHFKIEKELHKNSINQKIANLEISHKAEIVSQRNKELTDLNEKIKKANEELKIEASLERVRSASIAMHSSDELEKVIRVLTDQLSILGFHFHTANFVTNESMPDWEIWISSPGLDNTPPRIHVPYFDHILFNERNKAITTGKEFLTASLNKEEKNRFFHYLFEETAAKITPAERKEWVYQQKGMGLTTVLMKNISLSVINYDGTLYTIEENEVIKRLAGVFEQSYTRFLDLQKAEAQAREAQIELALERVRARTMAMQKSDELREAVLVIYEQLQQLNFDSKACNIIIIDKESGTAQYWVSGFSQEIFPESYMVPYLDHPYQDMLLKTWRQGDKYVVYEYTGQMKQSFDELFFTQTEFRNVPEEAKKVMIGLESVTLSTAFFSYGALQSLGAEPLSEEKANILKRFAKVFEQTYTRFLDLQKAEAQVREAQIEAGLERVRAKTMAMHKSDEVTGIAVSLNEELLRLGFARGGSTIIIINRETGDTEQWTGFSEDKTLRSCFVPYLKHPCHDGLLNSWKKGEKFFVYTLQGDEKKALDDHYFATGYKIIPENDKKWMRELQSVTFSHAFMKYGAIHWAYDHLSEEQLQILQRFSKVFEQSYTRFLDLQKAEAQAREAQIEAALERVRSRTMGMQKSEELKDVIQVVYEQFVHLNIHVEHTGFIMDYKQRNDMHIWLADKHAVPFQVTIPYFDCAHWNSFNEAKEKGMDFFANKLSFEEKNKFYQDLFKLIPDLPEETLKYYFSCPGLAISTVLLENVCLYIENFSGIPYSDEENKTLMRFGKVFQQTYTRFLDLQKAEAQAREAKIEAALEKVRSRTMAMQKSGELAEVATILFQQVKALGVPQWTCGFGIFEIDDKEFTWYPGNPDGDILPPVKIPLTEHPVFISMNDSRKRGDELFIYEKEGEYQAGHYRYMQSLPGVGEMLQKMLDAGLTFPTFQIDHVANFSHGNLVFITYEHFPEMHDIFKRFAKVFEQTYTRFLDLQKAEAQARESQIETALEKIRSRSLAMHQSKELKEVIAITFEKLNELNVLLGTVAIQLFDKKSIHSVLWVGNTIQDPQMVDLPYDKQMMLEDTLVKDSWQAMIDGVDIINKEYSVEQKNKYFNFLFSKNSLTQIPEQAREVLRQMQSHIACLFVEKNSAFLVDSWAGQFFPKENLHVLKRAAKVFEQAYIRFLDLQKAEAQAREAQIEAALEKVRSRTLAMQKSDELAETAAEVFRQLIALGIEPNRLYIGIVKEETGDMEMWATDEDGTQVGKRFMFNKNENASVLKLYDGWKAQKKSVIVDMQGKELEDYFHYLNNVMHIPFKAGLTQKRRVQSVAYFSKGFIGMASPDGQGDETIQLLERFAAVFNLTFTRFNDLKVAEAHAVQAEEDLVKLQTEKKRAEDALSELQVTQKQLIQSEKMASLGELTAGIAHEIQNPLNFVNNFSDVNKELLLEMKEEIGKGNTEEVIAIANDVISNEEKINHHGKRADAIVKGMLQHSRSSSGVKEPTDINELVDEYLRLAYHGLRAKDKSFNATMKTDFDEKIGKVNVVPQEIGRVFLNLITNAFYVVAEKKKQLANGYEPTVTVTTKKESDKIVVSVKDNGNGIPQKVLDKIFQPFFTTKPTGQGTGLGLSLSYDIVKAHSGEIKVKTKDGEGSEFVISLPVV